MLKKIILSLFCMLPLVCNSATVGITSDADYYMFYGSFSDTRTPFNIGVNDITAGSPYQYHFNVAGIEMSDISNFQSGNTALLYLNLQRFRVPGTVVPGYQGPPTFSLLTSGVTFTLKVVALTDSFDNIQYASSPLNWYENNLLNQPTVASVNFTEAGWKAIDVTSAFDQWKAGTLSNNGLGLVGTYSSITGTTAQFYSSETESAFGPYVNIIPEPTIFKYIFSALFIFLIIRQFAK
jgi:hypothetical protein